MAPVFGLPKLSRIARSLPAVRPLILASCSDTPKRISYSTNSYASTPAIVEAVLLNGMDMNAGWPAVVVGSADREMPRNQGIAIWSYTAGPQRDRLSISARWVKLLTRRAFRADTLVPIANQYSSSEENVVVTLIFDPNGQIIIGSDPVPTSAEDQPIVHVADVCGQRNPEADFDYRQKVDEIAGLADALEFTYPSVKNSKCAEDRQ